MSKADKMFKELGFNMLEVYEVEVIYRSEFRQITFDLRNKLISVSDLEFMSAYFSYDELQAINEKAKELRMELVEKAIKTINEYCTSNYTGCSECDIEVACEKYFNREPRNWKIPKEWKEDKEVF